MLLFLSLGSLLLGSPPLRRRLLWLLLVFAATFTTLLLTLLFAAAALRPNTGASLNYLPSCHVSFCEANTPSGRAHHRPTFPHVAKLVEVLHELLEQGCGWGFAGCSSDCRGQSGMLRTGRRAILRLSTTARGRQPG
jgi:hypothetical protein